MQSKVNISNQKKKKRLKEEETHGNQLRCLVQVRKDSWNESKERSSSSGIGLQVPYPYLYPYPPQALSYQQLSSLRKGVTYIKRETSFRISVNGHSKKWHQILVELKD